MMTKLMKQSLISMTAFLLSLSLVACGGSAASSAPASSASETASAAEESSAASSAPASSAPEAASAQGSSSSGSGGGDTLVMGTSADYAPFEFHTIIDGKDTIVGFDISLAQAIADDLGKELVIKDMAFDSILMELQLGTIDFAVAGIVPTEERKQSVDFSDPYYSTSQTVVILKEDADKYTGLDSFAGVSVGAQTNTVQAELVETVLTGASPVLLQTIPNLIMELKSGKIEAVCLESTVAEGYVSTQDDLMIAMEVPYEGSVNAVAVQKGNTELLAAIDATIDKVLENGQMEQFIQEASALANQAAG